MKFGAAGIVLLVLLGAWLGGDTGVAFFSGSISGITRTRNYLSPLHTVKSRRSFQLIRQIALEASYLDTMERALFNYRLRAYLTGDYLSVVVPYDDDFLVKASICERSYGEELEIQEILGESAFLLLMDSVTAFTEPVIDVYTDWSVDELKEHITKVHPVD